MTDAQPTPSAAAPQQPVVIERTYPASVSDLWNLWTTKTGFASWWGPEGFRVEVHTLDARAGGALHYDMIADTPEAIAAMNSMGQPLTHSTHGWFADFTPETRLVLMHKIDFVRGMAPYDSKVDVDFQPVGDRARMVVTIHPHADPHWTRMATQGFRSQFGKLDRRLV